MKALVVLSGGQDSATCAAWAKMTFDEVSFLTFNYGQRHAREIKSAEKIAMLFGGEHAIIEIPVLTGGPNTALTDKRISTKAVNVATGLPTTFVPARNLIFLTSAAGYALARGIKHIVTGVCQTDYSGYPDCRDETIKALEKAIALGCGGDGVKIHTPLMWLTKAETVHLAARIPGGTRAVALSWTCYEGGDKPCGDCPACQLRVKGFAEAGLDDWANAAS